MSTCKISYNGNEISAVDETAPVSVTYNNATIVTLNDGDTKTLGCHGKVMVSDVAIGSKTLNCNGKLMQGNIVVELVGSTPSGDTWLIDDYPDWTSIPVKSFNFISNNIQCTGIKFGGTPWNKQISYITADGDFILVHKDSYGWVITEFQTIILEEPASGDFLTWLQSNATKLS